ncbi:MAG TPA: hypothetical protein VIK81_04315 [Patescibacteria group bacterium]
MRKLLSFNFLLLILSVIFVLSVAFGQPASAVFQNPDGAGSSSQTFGDYQNALDEPSINLQQFSLFNLDYTAFGMTKLLVGVPTTQNTGAPAASRQNEGALSHLMFYVGEMYSAQPVSGIQYLASLKNGFTLVPPVQAQGIGYEKLQPVVKLWTVMRNLAYIGFVVVFVLVGFMVIFRSRIDPRTVASIQDALPRIVVSLILVTFSFAIAGFIIDITEVTTRLIGNVLAGSNLFSSGAINDLIGQLQSPTSKQNIFTLFSSLVDPARDGTKNIVAIIADSIQSSLGDILGTLNEFIGTSVIGLIFSILIIFTSFKVFMMLLTALVTLVMMTIFSPIMFLASALPGVGAKVIGNWFRGMLSAALTFPVTFGMLLIAALFLGAGDPWGVSETNEVITGFKYSPVPLGAFQNAKDETILITKIIGLGILFTIPKAADMVKEALSVRTPEWAGEAGKAIGGAFRRAVPFV